MAFNFPSTPTEGQIFTDATSGAQYVYRGTVWMQSSAAQIKIPGSNRNILANGAFQISQHLGSGGSITSGQHIADCWPWGYAGVSASATQVFSSGLGRFAVMLNNTAGKASLAAGDFLNLQQR